MYMFYKSKPEPIQFPYDRDMYTAMFSPPVLMPLEPNIDHRKYLEEIELLALYISKFNSYIWHQHNSLLCFPPGLMTLVMVSVGTYLGALLYFCHKFATVCKIWANSNRTTVVTVVPLTPAQRRPKLDPCRVWSISWCVPPGDINAPLDLWINIKGRFIRTIVGQLLFLNYVHGRFSLYWSYYQATEDRVKTHVQPRNSDICIINNYNMYGIQILT